MGGGKARGLACALMLTILLAAGAAVAQQDVIRRIIVEGNQRVEPETVQAYMTLHPGDPFDPQRIDESLKTLFATSLFADVTIRREGDSLVISVVENPIINQVAFEGNVKVDDETLAKEIELRPRSVYTRARVQNAVQRIVDVYRRGGRFAARVEPKVIQLPQNRVDLVFEITEGPVTKVERINFIGNDAFSDADLRRAIATKESRWWRFLGANDTYDPDRLTYDREALRRFYLTHGYADFRVVSAVAELTRDRESFLITFTVDEGEVYRFGDVDVTTELEALDPAALKPLVTTKPGEVFNAEEIDNTIDALTYAAGASGYAFVDIRPRVERDREKRLINLTFEINEGPRVYVERINITGNVRTLDRVIRRELRLVEGDAFNVAAVARSEQRIRALGFFDTVEITQQEGTAPDRTVLNVGVEERSTGELSLGLGFSSADAILGEIAVTERNLLGRGQFLRLALRLSERRRQADLSFTEPYFLDRRLAAGFDLFSTQTDFQNESSFDTEALGFALRTGFPLTEHLRLGFRYGLRQDEIKNVSFWASRFIQEAQGKDTTSSVGYRLSYDRTDDPIRPSRGVEMSLRQDFAGLGGTVDYLRTEGEMSYYIPIASDIVGMLRLRDGYIFGINDDVRITDRFFRGGATFRGFDEAGIGPRDVLTDDALGGNLYYIGTAELSFPLGLPEEFGILGSVFTEAGSLMDIDDSGPFIEDEGSLRASVGVGVFWESPFGPIRLDFAQAVRKEDYDETQFFRFNIGTRF